MRHEDPSLLYVYGQNLEARALPHEVGELICPQSQPLDNGLTLRRLNAADSDFAAILALRRRAYRTAHEIEVDRFDAYSDHFAIFRENECLAAVRVTRAAKGPLECEEFYPQEIFVQFRDLVGSASRYCALSENREVANRLAAWVWEQQAELGMELDIVNVRAGVERYYAKLGYRRVKGYHFQHPVWQTDSRVMLCMNHWRWNYAPPPGSTGERSERNNWFEKLCLDLSEPLPTSSR